MCCRCSVFVLLKLCMLLVDFGSRFGVIYGLVSDVVLVGGLFFD